MSGGGLPFTCLCGMGSWRVGKAAPFVYHGRATYDASRQWSRSLPG
jgi:hypothetical protein